MLFERLSDLWSAAAKRLAHLQMVFGAPFDFLSAPGELTHAERRTVLRHLAPLERLVRAVLLALARCEPLLKPARAPRPRRAAPASAAPSWPGPDSATWRGVRFRVLPLAPRPRSSARLRHGERAQVFDRYPLARRMEALARVIAAPERVIRRLAVMLRTQRDRVAVAIARVVRPNPRAPADLEAAATLLRLAPPADTS